MPIKGVKSKAFTGLTITSVKFRNQCKYVGDEAFRDCIYLDEINDDNAIENIGKNAFESTNLKSVKFNKLNDVDSEAFKSCSNLTSVNMPKCTNIKGGIFQDCTSLEEIEIPNVSSIGVSAFEGCTNLKKVTNNVRIATIVYNNAFKSCYNLKNIDFDSFKYIGAGAFINCRSIDKLDLNSCETIGESAFEGCSNISQLTLSVCKKIDPNAFANCSKLTKVYIKNNSDTFCELEDEHVFCTNNESHEFVNDEILFYFNAEVLKNYSDDEKWSHYLGHMIPMANSQQIIYRTTDNKEIEGIVNEYIKDHFYDGKSKYGLIEFNNDITSLTDIFKGKETLSSIDIPSKCTTIEANSFEDCINLNSITLSDSLTQIGDYAFKNCESFTSFTIPQSVTTLGEGIFAGCKNIEKISGNFVTYNGRAIVRGNKLIYVLPKDDSSTEGRIHKISEISTYITILGKSCFHGCEKMRRVDIPSTITNIGDNAFEGCTNLYEIHFSGATPPTLGDNVFEGVRPDFKIFVPEAYIEAYYNKWKDSEYISNILPKPDDNSIIYYGSKLAVSTITSTEHNDIFNNVPYYKISNIADKTLPSDYFTEQNLITTVIIGDGITKISENAFKNCKSLNYIYLSDSISELNNQCFYGCEELTRIHIPDSVKKNTTVGRPVVNISPKTYAGSVTLGGSSIVDPTIVYIKSPLGNDIFCGCSKLKEFGTYYKGRVSDDNRCYIDNNTLMFFAQGDMSDEEKSYEIPNSITSINRSAFRGSQITNITLSESTEIIGDYAFEGCSQLKSIYNWDNVKTISPCAFKDCSSLGEISLPSYLMTINQNAFDGCSEMYTNTDIPNSVVSIGSGAFRDCTNFKYVNTLGEDETLNLGSIKHINTYMFYNCESLTKININDNITIIDSNAFANCLNLTSVSISSTSSLENINENAFKGCKKLTELHLPNLTYIGNSAFEDCTNYKGGNNDLIIPSTLKSMGNACFKNSGVEKLSILNNFILTEIPNSMFEDCTKLSEVLINDLSSNIETIGTNAFKNCQNLNCVSKGLVVGNKYGSLRLPNSVKTIKDSAFEGCGYISYIYFPDELSRIGDKSFSKQSWTYIYIPENLKTPPAIKSDQLWGLANPFSDNDNFYIYIPNEIFDTYASNLLWKKFKDKMKYYTPDDSDIPVIKPDNPLDPIPPIVTDPIIPVK